LSALDENFRHRECPLLRDTCPGESECAPAALLAGRRNAELDLDTQGVAEPVCPIVDVVSALGVLATALMPLLLGSEDDSVAVVGDTVDDRLSVLGALKLDREDGT